MKIANAVNPFQSLDASHQQIHTHLAMLADLLQQLDAGADSATFRKLAAAVEVFFSGNSRQHHIDEEKNVFPDLLANADAELLQVVQTLQQDHHWIELDWTELAPMLRALAQGEDWVDLTEFRHNAEVFLALSHDHIVLEETLVYPAARAKLAQP